VAIVIQPATHKAVEELIETFELLEDWEERYSYLIDLGRKLPEMEDADKVEANRVRGCQSTVWMTARVRDSDPPVIDFLADSDSHIVKGLIAILQAIYSGQQPRFVRSFDARPVFARLGLEEHLSPTRRTGLHSMLKRIRDLAGTHAPART